MSKIVIAALLAVVASAQTDPVCKNDFNCSYNGVCSSGSCVCSKGWMGSFCHALDLQPATNSSGLDQLRMDAKTSTWGGTVMYYEGDKQYHMWASEISQHCGIHRWISNSIIVHATSAGPPGWKFERKEAVMPLFSHEPIVARAPSGEFVLYFTAYDGPGSDEPMCNCTDGSSKSGEPGCANEVGSGKNKSLYTYFSSAKTPSGPWSKPVSLQALEPNPHIDLNFAPVISKDGSLKAWTRWEIWEASNWKDASTYKNMGQAPDFNHGAPWEGEDPSMWMDKHGRYHILSHAGDRGNSTPFSGDCGRHFFSETGEAGTWMVAPFDKADIGGCAFPRVNVPFADGSNYSFYRRERPHLVLGPDGYTPVALSTAVIDSPLGPGMPGFDGDQRDASYTLIQPIN
jgi:hypothetical protein